MKVTLPARAITTAMGSKWLLRRRAVNQRRAAKVNNSSSDKNKALRSEYELTMDFLEAIVVGAAWAPVVLAGGVFFLAAWNLEFAWWPPILIGVVAGLFCWRQALGLSYNYRFAEGNDSQCKLSTKYVIKKALGARNSTLQDEILGQLRLGQRWEAEVTILLLDSQCQNLMQGRVFECDTKAVPTEAPKRRQERL